MIAAGLGARRGRELLRVLAGRRTAVPERTPRGPVRCPSPWLPLQRRTVERTVNVVGTLRGWEQVTVGLQANRTGLKVLHDMGDRVRPGEPLVELDPIDAKLAYDQAQSKFLAELVKLDITEETASAVHQGLWNPRGADPEQARRSTRSTACPP